MKYEYIRDPQTIHRESWEDIETQRQLRDSFFDKSTPISMVRSFDSNFEGDFAWVSNTSGESRRDQNSFPIT